MYNKTIKAKMVRCREFIEKLADILKDDYVLVPSCNKDLSAYLVPKGTEKDITYYGKPSKSFRVSDHWNWLSSIKRCSYPNLVQCDSVDMPWCRRRSNEYPDLATDGRIGAQVAYYGKDNRYHCVFGEKFDRKTKTWSWMDNTPEAVVDILKKGDLV